MTTIWQHVSEDWYLVVIGILFVFALKALWHTFLAICGFFYDNFVRGPVRSVMGEQTYPYFVERLDNGNYRWNHGNLYKCFSDHSERLEKIEAKLANLEKFDGGTDVSM